MQAGHRTDARIGVAAELPLFFQCAPAAGVSPFDPATDVGLVVGVSDSARRHRVGHHLHRAAGPGVFVGGQVPQWAQIQRRRLQEPEPLGYVPGHAHVHVAADAVDHQRAAGTAGVRLLYVQDVGQAQHGAEGIGSAVPQAHPQGRVQRAERDCIAQAEGGANHGRIILLQVRIRERQVQTVGRHGNQSIPHHASGPFLIVQFIAKCDDCRRSQLLEAHQNASQGSVAQMRRAVDGN